MNRLKDEVGIGQAETLANSGKGADLVREASRHFPATWVTEADGFGPLYAKLNNKSRGWYRTIDNNLFPVGSKINLRDFGVVTVEKNAGYIVVRDDIGSAIHEYAHRLQTALPKLQQLFKELHNRRTAGDALESLKKLEPLSRYRKDELTRHDNYIDPYWGKDYSGEPLEVMPMAMQTVLAGPKWMGGKYFTKLYNDDREMFDFVVGLLFHWKP